MGKKLKSQTMEEFLAGIDNHINVESHLDPKIVEEHGFFRKAVTMAGLWKFVTAVPTKILGKVVAEILLNLKEGETSSTFTDPEKGTPVKVELSVLAGAFDLPKEGASSLLELELSVGVEFARFAVEGAVFDAQKGSIRTDLKSPFKLICKLFSKSITRYVGNLGQLSDTKLFATTVITDSLTGTKFNWHGWFINQIHKVAKDFKFVPGSTDKILRKGKLKFFSRISYALEKVFENKRWTDTSDYKKNSVFYDTGKIEKLPFDREVVDVVVPPAVPVAERQIENPSESLHRGSELCRSEQRN